MSNSNFSHSRPTNAHLIITIELSDIQNAINLTKPPAGESPPRTPDDPPAQVPAARTIGRRMSSRGIGRDTSPQRSICETAGRLAGYPTAKALGPPLIYRAVRSLIRIAALAEAKPIPLAILTTPPPTSPTPPRQLLPAEYPTSAARIVSLTPCFACNRGTLLFLASGCGCRLRNLGFLPAVVPKVLGHARWPISNTP